MYADKLPPHDLDAEAGVLYCIIMDEQAMGKVVPILEPADFYREQYRHIYEAALAVFDRNEPVNQITVTHELDVQGHLDLIGGPEVLSHLIATTFVPPNVANHYAKMVSGLAIRRRRIAAAGQLMALEYEQKDSAQPLEDLIALSEGRADERREFKSYKEIGDEVFNDLDDWLANGAKPKGLLTGLKKIDKELDGLGPGRMYLFAGRPSMGKSELARTICENVARQGKIAAYISLEMPRSDIFMRSMFAAAGIDRRAINPIGPSEQQERALRDALGELSDLKLWVMDTADLDVRAIRTSAKALRHRLGGLDLLAIDHIGHIEDNPSAKAYEQMRVISKRVMGLAKVLDVPVIALAQLNRGCEARGGQHIPMLADLRDSGTLEQDAFAVAFLWRYDYYHARKDPAFTEDNPEERNRLHVIIAKNRAGPCGEVKLFYDETTGRIGNLEEALE